MGEETAFDAKTSMIAEDSRSDIPPSVSESHKDMRRHSTGKAKVLPRNVKSQVGSTHDLCKHGKRCGDDAVKPLKLARKKNVEGENAGKKETLGERRKSWSGGCGQSSGSILKKLELSKREAIDGEKQRVTVKLGDAASVKKVSRVDDRRSSKDKNEVVSSKNLKTDPDNVPEKTLYVVESSIEKKPARNSKNSLPFSSMSSERKGSEAETSNAIRNLHQRKEKIPGNENKPKRVVGIKAAPLTTRQLGFGNENKPKRAVGIKAVPLTTRQLEVKSGKVLESKSEGLRKRVVPKMKSDGKKKSLKDKRSNYTEGKPERVVLRHRKVEEKKKLRTLFNTVIEETASKLGEEKKSKVEALVGAFETVISLQSHTKAINKGSVLTT